MGMHARVRRKLCNQHKASGCVQGFCLTDRPATKEGIETNLCNSASVLWRRGAGVNLNQFTENGKDCVYRGSGIAEALDNPGFPFRIFWVGSSYNTELLIKLIRSVISWSSQESFFVKQSLIILTGIVSLSIYRLAVGNTDCSRVPVLLRSRGNQMGTHVRCELGVTQSDEFHGSLQVDGFLHWTSYPQKNVPDQVLGQCVKTKSSFSSFRIVNSGV